jgi:hypothetical protein
MNEDQLAQLNQATEKWHAFYDEHFRQLGRRAPAPILNQHPNDYRREMLRSLKKTYLPKDHEYYKVDMRSLPDEVITPFELKVIPAAIKEAFNPENVPQGELRPLKVLDELGQVRAIKYIGQESFVKDQKYGYRPGRRVASFLLNGVHVDASGRALR